MSEILLFNICWQNLKQNYRNRNCQKSILNSRYLKPLICMFHARKLWLSFLLGMINTLFHECRGSRRKKQASYGCGNIRKSLWEITSVNQFSIIPKRRKYIWLGSQEQTLISIKWHNPTIRLHMLQQGPIVELLGPDLVTICASGDAPSRKLFQG